MAVVSTGLDVLKDEAWRDLKGLRLGLLSNQASLSRQLQSTQAVLSKLLPGQLKALFGPQHGYGGEDQDNMVETDHSFYAHANVPVFSLYSEFREPLPHMLDLIDALIIDLQDTGTRVYTFASTMLACLRVASRYGKRVVILDRPNPLGGEIVEGNLLKPELYSFVGCYALPMRHGLTMGEMARLFNHVFSLGCDLHVVPMRGWRRTMIWRETGLRWVMPSPNMPVPETAQVYPGQVLWEGTNVSEGRGTCRPFEIFGAPFLDLHSIIKGVGDKEQRGFALQQVSFRPTFHKWQGKICKGFMLHITSPKKCRPYSLSLALLREILYRHRPDFTWKNPPYEYEYQRLPIDLILGDSTLRQRLEDGISIEGIWDDELKSYKEWRAPYLLY
ncbi:MAG: DUF1343 domain-containing protein [Deltaproteobacteria bacterium]|nr:DUF1343 domain-containing protein [Deltaproteobacteria bacterium]